MNLFFASILSMSKLEHGGTDMKRRSKIRIAAFSAALFTAMLAWAVTATVKADRFGRRLRVNDQQALTQLCEYFDNIEISLMKSLYANSDSMLSVLSADLQKQATGAKASLSALSTGGAAFKVVLCTRRTGIGGKAIDAEVASVHCLCRCRQACQHAC